MHVDAPPSSPGLSILHPASASTIARPHLREAACLSTNIEPSNPIHPPTTPLLAYVRAPTDGEILKIHTRAGEKIGSAGIAEMGRTEQMIAIAEVLEEDIGKIRLGQKAAIRSENLAFAGELRGTVIDVGRQIGKQDALDSDPAADVDARVVEIKVGLTPEASQRVSGLTYAKVIVKINI